MKPPVLVLNIGNTHTTAAVLCEGRVHHRQRLVTRDATAAAVDRVLSCLRPSRCQGSVIASVVPTATDVWRRALRQLGRPCVEVRWDLPMGIRWKYPHPETLGADRVANIAAAQNFGRPLIVVDVGTATTFDAVDSAGAYLGGVIAPGPGLMLDYLAERTAQLPRVPWRRSRRVLGHCTITAMQLGAEAGYAGLVRGILERMRKHPQLRRACVVLTGGAAQWILPLLPAVRYEPDWTLRGLERIFRSVLAARDHGTVEGCTDASA